MTRAKANEALVNAAEQLLREGLRIVAATDDTGAAIRMSNALDEVIELLLEHAHETNFVVNVKEAVSRVKWPANLSETASLRATLARHGCLLLAEQGSSLSTKVARVTKAERSADRAAAALINHLNAR